MAERNWSILETTENIHNKNNTVENWNATTDLRMSSHANNIITTDKPESQDPIANIVFLAIGVLAVLGNALVIFIGMKSSAMRQLQSNLLILSQSGIDLVSGVCIILYYIPYYEAITYSVFNIILCKIFITGFAVDSAVMASTNNLILITFEKYLMIIHPIRHRNWFTETKIKWLIVVAVILGPPMPLVVVVKGQIAGGDCDGYGLLNQMEMIIVSIANLLFMVIIPIGMIVYVYTAIFIRLRKQRKDLHDNKQQQVKNPRKAAEMNTLKTMCIVAICYCFCHFPRIIGAALFSKGNLTLQEKTISHCILAFGYFNSAINPFIYAFKHERFKKELKKYFLCKKLKGVGTSTVWPETTASKQLSQGGSDPPTGSKIDDKTRH